MGDEKSEKDVSRDCVMCGEAYQLAFWTHHFGVSSEVLLDVVRRVGPKLKDVTAELVIHPK